jgi:hypothetical protein
MPTAYREETQRAVLFIVLAVCMSAVSSSAQNGPFDNDLKEVTTSGKVENNGYSNRTLDSGWFCLSHPVIQNLTPPSMHGRDPQFF